jgi:hypothetical protein
MLNSKRDLSYSFSLNPFLILQINVTNKKNGPLSIKCIFDQINTRNALFLH